MRLKCIVPNHQGLNYEFQCTTVIKQEMFIIPKVKRQVTRAVTIIISSKNSVNMCSIIIIKIIFC